MGLKKERKQIKKQYERGVITFQEGITKLNNTGLSLRLSAFYLIGEDNFDKTLRLIWGDACFLQDILRKVPLEIFRKASNEAWEERG